MESLRSRGLAVDAYGPAVEALRRTAVSNQLEERLLVKQRFICDEERRKPRVRSLCIYTDPIYMM